MTLLALVQAAYAAQVALALDSSDVREGQTIGMTLTVVDASARAVPEIPVPEGLDVRFQSQGSSMTIINFQRSVATTYRYALTALTRGDYVIGPIPVATADGTLKTEPVTLHVGARASGGTDSIVADIGTEVAYVGQVLVYHLRFQTEKALVTAKWGPPQPQGFTAESTVKPETAEYQLAQDGKPLAVEELYYPLRASAPGKWHLGTGVLRAQFPDTRQRSGRDFGFPGSPFRDVRTEVFSSNALDVEVKPLPAEGRPAGASDLVGRFTVTAQASATDVKVGDTVTLDLTVVGDGTLAGFALPPLEGEGFRVYDDQPVLSARLVDGKYEATAAFKRAIVPQSPGKVEIPAVTLAYFDPGAGAWNTASTQPITLNVGAGEAGEVYVDSFSTPGATTVDALAEDILPVRTNVRLSRPLSGMWSWALLVPGAGALLAEGSRLVVRKPRAVAQRRLSFDDLPRDPEARLAGLDRILRERAGGALGMPPDAVRREDLSGLGDVAEAADTVWRELEALRYGGAADATSGASSALLGAEERLRALVGRLP